MRRRERLVLGGVVVAVLLVVWVSAAGPVTFWRSIEFGDSEFDAPPPTTVVAEAPATTVPAGTSKPADLGWLLSALLMLGAVALVAALAWWLATRDWTRRRRPRRVAPFQPLPEIAPDELLDAADEFDLLIARGSARNAIVACWVRLEEAVDQAGIARDPAETSTEMTGRVLGVYDVDAQAVGTLAALYREARFSTHEMHEGHRRTAQATLAEIRRQLHEAAARARDAQDAAEATR